MLYWCREDIGGRGKGGDNSFEIGNCIIGEVVVVVVAELSPARPQEHEHSLSFSVSGTHPLTLSIGDHRRPPARQRASDNDLHFAKATELVLRRVGPTRKCCHHHRDPTTCMAPMCASLQMLVQVRTIIKFENGGTNLDIYKSHIVDSRWMHMTFQIRWVSTLAFFGRSGVRSQLEAMHPGFTPVVRGFPKERWTEIVQISWGGVYDFCHGEASKESGDFVVQLWSAHNNPSRFNLKKKEKITMAGNEGPRVFDTSISLDHGLKKVTKERPEKVKETETDCTEKKNTHYMRNFEGLIMTSLKSVSTRV
ncbi:hypothetical protein LXL04_026868 [Taraxacum kok-saghyz]